MSNSNNMLEFNIILERLAEGAMSQKAKDKALALSPFLSERECRVRLGETTEATKITEAVGSPPIASMKELDKILELTEKGSMLVPEQLTSVATFITACRRTKAYLKKAENLSPTLCSYGASFAELIELFEMIDESIRGMAVTDGASTTLRDIRRKIGSAEALIKSKLETILRSKKEWFSENYIATRNGRFVLPVKREYKNQVSGSVIDTSASGATYFIEPSAVRKIQDEIDILQIDEDNEVRKILYTLTVFVDEHIPQLKINMDCMETLDFIFAKAKLSTEMHAIPPSITTDRRIVIKNGRHPLLKQDINVPLNFEIGGDVRGVVITGPNTGGKTVALKTVGLLSLMAQSGLHVPAEFGSVFAMNSNVLCDIGDGQSISQNLSTFSSHITNVIDILKEVSSESLVLLDELGSGTDPAEGMGIAAAILEELRQRNCLFVATTHYPEIKEFAANTEFLINARMEFDRESLKPLYRLEIGEAGESCALYIARRLGFPEHMLKRAHQKAYENHGTYRASAQNEMQFEDEVPRELVNSALTKIQKIPVQRPMDTAGQEFVMGDSVMVHPQKEIGIVYKPIDQNGEIIVQIKGKKQPINHKRIKLIAPAAEMYPADYDFSIVFDSTQNRKARHIIQRKHDPNAIIKLDE